MRYVKDIFEAFGGNQRISELTGEEYPTVSSWLQRCSVPSRHWPTLIDAAKTAGIDLTLETLLKVQRNRSEERALRQREAAQQGAAP